MSKERRLSRPSKRSANTPRLSKEVLNLSKEGRSRLKKKVKLLPLEDQEYYHGFIDKDEAHTALNNPGDFLVRTEMTNIGRRHFLEVVTPTFRKVSYPIQQSGRHVFFNSKVKRGSVPYLIHFCSKMDAGIDPTERGVLPQNPVPRPPWVIPYANVVLGLLLGKGAFGMVYRGCYFHPYRNKIDVAVKMNQEKDDEKSDEAAQTQFLNEANLMRSFHHPHVVQVYGVATQKKPNFIVMELVEGGAVSTVLRKAAADGQPVDMMEKMHQMLLPAGWAIEYLHHQKIVHRDIAVRNCLYSDQKVLKITDFGLSRAGEIYHLKHKKRALPYRHYPPEALQNKEFTQLGDVWSYGILLSELMTDAAPLEDLTKWYCKGFHFELAPNTPPEVASIFKDHVLVGPKIRKHMTEICPMLEKVLDKQPILDNKVVRKEAKEQRDFTGRTTLKF